MAEAISATAQPDEKRPDGSVAGSAVEQNADAKSQAKKPGVISHITGWHVWKRQARTLGRRASFPLLRQVWKSQVALSKAIIPHEIVPDEYLVRTLKGHKFLLVFMAVVLLWGVLTTVKGFAAGILHGMWINNWIIGGIPIVVLATARIIISYRVVGGVGAELQRRSKQVKKDVAQERTQ